MRLLGLCLLLAAAALPQSTSRLDQVSRFFARPWEELFARYGMEVPMPKLAAFTNSAQSACGPVASGNAYYCEKDDSIYYDSEFLEALRIRVSKATGTRGEGAPVVALAHEFGHAVYARFNAAAPGSRLPYQRLNGYGQEKIADCVAGAFTRAAVDATMLDADTLVEAEETMSVISAPATAPLAYFRRHQTNHPNWRVRRDTFRLGFERGFLTCSVSRVENLSQ